MVMTMIDTVESLIQARDASEAGFRDTEERLRALDKFVALVFEEGVRVLRFILSSTLRIFRLD